MGFLITRDFVKHKFCLSAICLLIFCGCATKPYEKSVILDSIGGNTSTLVLNYETAVNEFSDANIDTHMKIYIEIEKPRIISIPVLKGIERIYPLAEIEGTAVFRVEIDEKGRITSSKKVLSAGFGLDEIAGDLLKQLKIEPAYLAGNPGKSAADIKFLFRAE
jgi:hypothetical protein